MKALHKVTDIAMLGLHSLSVHVVRSILTALGIIIGVCSVVIMLAANAGAAHKAAMTLRALGSNNIIINTIKLPDQTAGGSSRERNQINAYGLLRSDVPRLSGSVPGITRCVVARVSLRDTHVRGQNLTVAAVGTEPEYLDVARLNILAGRFITELDKQEHKAHCVVTASLAERMFAFENPLGKVLTLDGEPFVVVGVMDRLPPSLAGRADEAGNNVIIPLTADQDRFGDVSIRVTGLSRTIEKVELSQIIMQMENEQSVIEGSAVARGLLAAFHDSGDYDLVVPLELIAQQKQQMHLWNMMSVVIAAVSLVVGGIGIMNIMLASVTERTREIGVRRALGAKKRDIIAQFLIEAVMLTTVGGLIGIAIGRFAPLIIERWIDFTAIVTPATLVVPFMMAVLVGLVSGLYPALRAANLNPIEALRHE
ncbi:MAG: ABC transporter permease [Planctomycetaceae bacterium]|nr:ABC transporter permease [Planctomycetaceae bacterium]